MEEMIALMGNLLARADAAREAVLPPGTPPISATPKALCNDNVNTTFPELRRAFQGTLIAYQDNSSGLIANGALDVGTESRKFPLSLTGDTDKASMRTVDQISTARPGGAVAYIKNFFIPLGEITPHPWTAAGIPVVFRPVVDQSGLSNVNVTMSGKDQTLTIKKAVELVDAIALPWGGAPARPPPFPAMPGVPDEGDAADVVAPVAMANSEDGPANLIRRAKMDAMGITMAKSDDAAELIAGVACDPSIARALTVAFATAAGHAAAGDHPAAGVARTAVGETAEAWNTLLDNLHHQVVPTVATMVQQLADAGLSVENSQRGEILRQTINKFSDPTISYAPAPAPIPAPAPAVPATGGAPDPAVAAAIAAALGGDDRFLAEATRLLASSSLSPEQMRTAVPSVAAQLAARSGAGPHPSNPSALAAPSQFRAAPPPLLSALPSASFGPLRPIAGLGLTNEGVVAAISDAFSKTPADLTGLIGTTVGRSSHAFFDCDPVHDAQLAAEDVDKIFAALPAPTEPPASWEEAGRRLRAAIHAYKADVSGRSQGANGGGGIGYQSSVADATVISRATTSSARRTACHPTVISSLTTHKVIEAERQAVRSGTVIDEVRRLADAPYADAALPFVFSDGKCLGTLPNKGAHHPITARPHSTRRRRTALLRSGGVALPLLLSPSTPSLAPTRRRRSRCSARADSPPHQQLPIETRPTPTPTPRPRRDPTDGPTPTPPQGPRPTRSSSPGTRWKPSSNRLSRRSSTTVGWLSRSTRSRPSPSRSTRLPSTSHWWCACSAGPSQPLSAASQRTARAAGALPTPRTSLPTYLGLSTSSAS